MSGDKSKQTDKTEKKPCRNLLYKTLQNTYKNDELMKLGGSVILVDP